MSHGGRRRCGALLAQVRQIAAGDIARAPIQRVHPTADAHRRQHGG